jgi:hypothetical protein
VAGAQARAVYHADAQGMPYIRKELELKSLLTHRHTLDCTCCILTATSADLDSIVESGLKNGLISIQEEAV